MTEVRDQKSEISNATALGTMVFALCSLLLAPCSSAQAQQPPKVPRIGYLTGNPFSNSPARTEALRQGLRELGYEEGKSILVEWRSAEGKLDRLPALASELVNLKVDVIVSQGPIATRTAKNATTSIPIVMGFDDDPVGNGFVASLARPGGNITGLSAQRPELSGKQLEILKEIVPKLARVAVFGNNEEPGNTQNLKEVELAAKALGIKIHYLSVVSPKDIEIAFRAATEQRTDALLLLENLILNNQRKQTVELAVKHRLPATYFHPEFIAAGGLMYYGTNYNDLFRRAATYVDKILKGAKPADLPVEQPTKFEFIINLKAAKQIGLTIPPNVLVRADKVIK
jgi:putative ABC transport system substrate-binding protein